MRTFSSSQEKQRDHEKQLSRWQQSSRPIGWLPPCVENMRNDHRTDRRCSKAIGRASGAALTGLRLRPSGRHNAFSPATLPFQKTVINEQSAPLPSARLWSRLRCAVRSPDLQRDKPDGSADKKHSKKHQRRSHATQLSRPHPGRDERRAQTRSPSKSPVPPHPTPRFGHSNPHQSEPEHAATSIARNRCVAKQHGGEKT